jgi:hypothetical protein
MTDNTCKTKYDCPNKQTCLGFCMTTEGKPDYNHPCSRNGDCGDPYLCESYCQGNNCGDYTCTSIEICATNLTGATKSVCIPLTCQSNSECSSTTTSYACVGGLCIDMSCDAKSRNLPDITLGDEYLCVKNKTLKGLLIPQVCTTNDDCREGLTGYSCQGGLCKSVNPTSCQNCSSAQTCCKKADNALWPYACCDNQSECCQGVNGNMCCVGDTSCVYDMKYSNGVCCASNQIANCPDDSGDKPCSCEDCPEGQVASTTVGPLLPTTICCPVGQAASCYDNHHCICCPQGQRASCSDGFASCVCI